MAAQDARSLLDALLPCFQRPDVTAGAAERTLELAEQLYEAADAIGLEACNADGSLER